MKNSKQLVVRLPQQASMEIVTQTVACLLGAKRKWRWNQKYARSSGSSAFRILEIDGSYKSIKTAHCQVIKVNGEHGIYITGTDMQLPDTVNWREFGGQIVTTLGGQLLLPDGNLNIDRPADRGLMAAEGEPMWRTMVQIIHDLKPVEAEIDMLPLLPEAHRTLKNTIDRSLLEVEMKTKTPPASRKKDEAKAYDIPKLVSGNVTSVARLAAFLVHVLNSVGTRIRFIPPAAIARASSALRYGTGNLNEPIRGARGEETPNPYSWVSPPPTYMQSEDLVVRQVKDVLSVALGEDVKAEDLPYPDEYYEHIKRMASKAAELRLSADQPPPPPAANLNPSAPPTQPAPQSPPPPPPADNPQPAPDQQPPPQTPAASPVSPESRPKFNADRVVAKLKDKEFARALVEELLKHDDGPEIVGRALQRGLLLMEVES